ncbi:MAG: L-lactate dehydrogenase [Candidatus Margulisbacteria bacterium]|nr:L-lactate dehydrogenase [Candidatus Margulisiibacteriota bacterium]MBU1729586.1 L-lactate dehydrogenase [Candidatus Margulisiibacteriota bacterium]MBU1956011.1 L-lactate dehydrogenase [Candidatus Margulisiibacteriota bacterium]
MDKGAKISLVGTGRVGSAVAFSTLIKGLAKEMVLVDYNPKAAEGDALDLLHASCFAQPVDVRGGDYPDTKDSDIVIISASIPMKDIKSRLDLCQGNVELFKQIIPKIAQASPNAIIILITNPLDIMTYAALKISGFPKERVIGTGTLIDSGRFRSLVANAAHINPEEIHAYIIGEHGDSQFPVLSRANVGGRKFRERAKPKIEEFFEQTKKGGYLVMEKKGFTNYAIALSTTTLVECIVKDLKKIYPVSTLVNDYYGVSDLCISVPTIIGSGGAERVIDLELDENEIKKFQDSAKILKDITTSLKF